MVDPTVDPLADAVDVEDIFAPNVQNWPYNGEERIVTLGNVCVEANEYRGTWYDENGSEVKFEAAKELDANDPPAGYTYSPELDLMLYMTVDDRALPEPQYPPKVKLGNEATVQMGEGGTTFRFIKKDGSSRLPDARSRFADFIRALAGIMPGFAGEVSKIKSDPERWFSVDLFNGLTFVMGPHTLGEGQYASTVAWPLRASGAETDAPAADTNGSNFDLVAAAQAASNAEEYRKVVLKNNGGGDSNLVKAVLHDADAAWQEALAAAS